MKSRERLQHIRQSKSWTERLALARDRLPGTPFDWLIPDLLGTVRSLDLHPWKRPKSYFLPDDRIDLAALNRDDLAGFGEDLARAVASGNSQLFRDWADAVDAWHKHKPYEDKTRAALIRFCVPPSRKFSMRSVIAHLVQIGIVPKAEKSEEHDGARRTVRRICAELQIRISGKAGHP